MRLTCPRATLMSAFQIVGGVVPSRTPREILKNVKLTVQGDEIWLIGTDGDGTGIRYQLQDVTADVSGDALLPTARVISILRELTDDSVEIDISNNATMIRSGYSEFRLSSEDPADFPPVPDFEDEDYHTINAEVLRKMIRRTIFATDTESTRYALGGILLELAADQVRLAATDSRRLAVTSAQCTVCGSGPGGNTPVIPSKAMTLIERSLGDGAEDVYLAVHQNDVVVRTGKAVISSQLVQGRFPDYRKVIPTKFTSKIALTAGSFYSAVRQSQVVTNDESRGVDFHFADGLLRLSSQAADIGQSKIELPISYDGPEVTITFDPRYIADFLKVLESSTPIEFNLIDGESPGVLTTEDDYTYVIMPLSRDR